MPLAGTGGSPFQSTLPARGATVQCTKPFARVRISIHAPRTGSDPIQGFRRNQQLDFNPRSPHGERLRRRTPQRRPPRFQSTLPARGATLRPCRARRGKRFQSTLPARGATLLGDDVSYADLFQSTLPARGATEEYLLSDEQQIFQSTLPARGATVPEFDFAIAERISIHAPRTGSDEYSYRIPPSTWHISIHAPRTGSDTYSRS